jgi:hypothetical protein
MLLYKSHIDFRLRAKNSIPEGNISAREGEDMISQRIKHGVVKIMVLVFSHNNQL